MFNAWFAKQLPNYFRITFTYKIISYDTNKSN